MGMQHSTAIKVEDDADDQRPTLGPLRVPFILTTLRMARFTNASVVAVLIGTTALVLAAVSCTLYFFSLPGSSTGSITEPRQDAGIHRGSYDRPLAHTRQLFCMFHVHGSTGAEYGISDVPTGYCNNIVVCCITEKDLDKDQNILDTLRYFIDKVPSVRVYIGLFAQGAKGSWLFEALRQPKGDKAIVDSFNTFIIKHRINGGVYMWIPNMKEFPDVPGAIKFISDFSVRLRLHSLDLVFTLPTDEPDLTAYFPVTALRDFQGKFVMITHFTPSFNVTDQRVPCSTPWKAWGSHQTLEQAFRSLAAWQFFDTVNASKRVLMSMDVVTYTYAQKRNFPYILTERMVAPYLEFCTVCSREDKTIKFWKVYQDKETQCRVAATEGDVRSSASPRLIRDMFDLYYNQFPGIVVHNIHLDDFTGVCGPPNGFIKSVYCELEKMDKEACNRIAG